MTLTEPAADMALCAAIASSFRNRPIDFHCAVMGEIGLAGEVRAVAQAERRIAECSRLGFKTMLLPKANLRSIRNDYGVKLCGVDTIAEAMSALGLFAN